MSNIIFYFSGTGNSLAAARHIADKTGDTRIVSIKDMMRDDSIDLNYERIGFVFPSYYSSTPSIVKEFIKKLNFNRSQYIFGLITFAGTYGMTLSQLQKSIAERDGILSAGFPVRMPGSYIDNYGAFPAAIQKILFKRAKKKLDIISDRIELKEISRIPQGSALSRSSEKSVNEILSRFGSMAGNFRTTEKCNGCGTCAKICPVGNIKLEGMQPKWGSVCEHCVACIQWCPRQAIEYADKTVKRKRYHNPEIKVSDMI